VSGFGFGPGNIDCDDVLKDVYLYLDGEADEQLGNRIREHLDACTPCLRQYGLEQDVRRLVLRCCGNEQAPPTLRERIRVRITEISVQSSALEYRPD
jgi:mycothiol system anti-sigma-R factor